MAQMVVSKCWMCGRASDQVSSSVGRPAEEMEMDRKLFALAESRARFARESADWWEKVPDQFRMMNFGFVINNLKQFGSVNFLAEASKAKSSNVEPLLKAINQIRRGEDASIGQVAITPGDSVLRDAVMSEVNDFEKRTGYHLEWEEGAGPARVFEGLKFGQGVSMLREIMMLGFSIQKKLLEEEKEEEMSRRPTFGVSVAKVNGLHGEIGICTVCQNLVTGLMSA
jgi:hypothetical protein